jgi:hypothetical protein
MTFSGRGGYLAAARHPWACVLFVLPLLAAYELGMLLQGPGRQDFCRNGADLWLRALLGQAGLAHGLWAPVLLVLGLLGWAWRRRRDRPGELGPVWVGMVLESAALAVGLWGTCHLIWPLLQTAQLSAGGSECDPAVERMLSYAGAGIYEEALFRLLLLSALRWLMVQADLPGARGLALAALLSAVLFSLAHHVGPQGEAFDAQVFFFRTLAGLYFGGLYLFRGFGIAVGAHAGYDVLVGILLET